MANEKEKIEAYGAAAGILAAIVSAFLLDSFDTKTCARVFVETIEENAASSHFPIDVIKIKDKVKEKYNL